VKNAISEFPVLQGSAEPLDRRGGKTMHYLISYFLSNTFAKNYRNRIVYVKIIPRIWWSSDRGSRDTTQRSRALVLLFSGTKSSYGNVCRL